MIKLQGLSGETVQEIASQTADAFYDYRYNDEDILLIHPMMSDGAGLKLACGSRKKL